MLVRPRLWTIPRMLALFIEAVPFREGVEKFKVTETREMPFDGLTKAAALLE